MIELIEEYVNRYQKWTLWGTITSKYSDFRDLLAALRQANEGDVIEIDLESSGGDCDVGYKIISHIKNCKGKVNIIASGENYSMGSLIAIAGDSLEMEENSYLMFHTYSSAIGKMKSGDLTNYVDNSHKRALALDDKYSKPFLTDNEVQRIRNGEEIYVWWNQDCLEKRKKRHFKGK